MQLAGLKRILIIRLSSFGDILLATPVIRSIKKNYPDLEIDFVIREQYSDILKENIYLHKVFTYTENNQEKSELINNLIEQKYDLVVDLQNNFRSKELLKSLKCPKLKFRKRDFDKFLLVNFKINRLKNAPPIPIRYAEALGNLSLDDESLDIFSSNQPNPTLITEKIYIGLCPGSKHFTKRWPMEHFINLGKLLEQNGYNVVLFGGKDDLHLCSELADRLNNVVNLCNDNDLLQTAADMNKCKVIFCNDSGLMHLATAVKVPVIAFFGSTVEEFGFFPYKSKSMILQLENLKCRPCSHIGRKSCPEKHFKCLNEISPQTAFDSLQKFIGAA